MRLNQLTRVKFGIRIYGRIFSAEKYSDIRIKLVTCCFEIVVNNRYA